MFTRKDFELQAQVLGSHVIPMCISFDWNAGGVKYWDLNKVNKYLNLGNYLVVKFQENPAFDLDRFNAKIWDWFINWIGPTDWDYLLGDKPGMALTGNEARQDWSFYPNHTMSY